MKAARFHTQGDIRIEDIPKPKPQPNQILVEVAWCGICGTDLHEYTSGPIVCPRPDQPHPLTGESVPVVMGHEFAGHVVEVPECSRSTFKPGQKVMVDPRLFCLSCHSCENAIEHLCSTWGALGLSGGGGGFSEYVAVDASMCHALPDDVNLDEAALIEPLCVARHGLAVSGIEDFSNLTALVIGGGPIGIATLWNLRAVGVKTLIISEPTEVRQRHCEDLTDHVLSPLKVDVGDECQKLTKGVGVDVVFDCAGIPAAMNAGFEALKRRGTYVNLAVWEKPFVVPFMDAILKEPTIKFSTIYDNKDFKAVVDDFVAGKLTGVGKMITGRILVEDLVEKGIEELINKKDQHVKIVATPKREFLDAARVSHR